MKLSLYIIIASRIQLFSRLRRFTSVERSLQNHLFMQNEPNFRKSQMNVSNYITMEYEKRTLGERGKNEPKTNPIYPCVASGEAGSNPISKGTFYMRSGRNSRHEFFIIRGVYLEDVV